MKIRRVLALLLAAVMLFSMAGLIGCGSSGGSGGRSGARTKGQAYVRPDVETSIPRNETLIFGGIQWGGVNGWNVLMGSSNNFANAQEGGGSRTLVWETPYMFNALDGSYVPLLADGPFTWNDNFTQLTYKIKKAAYWSDGTKVTAHDAQATWDAGFYTVGANGNWTPFIESVVATDDETVVITAATTGGVANFYLMVETYVIQNYILQKAWLETMLARNDYDADKISVDPGDDFVWSGPYTSYFDDDTRVVLIRDDGYWGQHSSMWGKLPAPKYISAVFLADNAAILAALQAGDIDVSQAFLPDVHKLWEEQGLPISTYIDKPPYHVAASLPTAHFNLTNPMMQEVELRRAIAWAVDYDAINANAMTYQSPTFAEVPRSLFNPTAGEQALYDQSKVAHLQWVGNDPAAANALLDASGKFPMGDDGWRTYNGEKVSIRASCPQGWSDWEAAMEIVADAGKLIGIEITTHFPDTGEFWGFTTENPPNPGSPEIFMFWTGAISPTGGWARMRELISSANLDTGWPWNWNQANMSQYRNPRADEIVDRIPLVTDPAELKALYTEAVEIYLTDVPSFTLMYRPGQFHTVYEGVWTGFTEAGDGRNVPPLICLHGYAMRDLFDLRLVN